MLSSNIRDFNKEELLKLDKFDVFNYVCENGYFEIVKWIYDEDYKLIESNNYIGFRWACEKWSF